MENIRTVRQVFKSQPVIEGAGVHLHRAFGYDECPLFDPFLLFDDFRSESRAEFIRGFPWHPHRGIETITYVLSGNVEHGDSMGNSGVISSGDVQWMTAGSGIIHQEMPKGDDTGRMLGFQLWANLPASHKLIPPRYRNVKQADIPTLTLVDGTVIRIICGESQGKQGAIKNIITNPQYLDITMPPAVDFTQTTWQGDTVIVYVIEGSAQFDTTTSASNRMLLLFNDGQGIRVQTTTESVRFLLFAGKPLKEPIAWYGPIVMNTEAELDTAFKDYQEGTFTNKK